MKLFNQCIYLLMIHAYRLVCIVYRYCFEIIEKIQYFVLSYEKSAHHELEMI